MKRKLILVGLVFLMIFIIPTDVRAYSELTYKNGTEIMDSTDCPDDNFVAFHYTIYDDVVFGGYFNVTDDLDIGIKSAEMSLLAILVLDDWNMVRFAGSGAAQWDCERLFELRDINITTGRVAWNYTQFTSIEYNVHIVYWYYQPDTLKEQQITFDYEHWDWARYQPPVETTTTVQIDSNIIDGQTYSGIVNIIATAYHPDGIAYISVATIEVGFICNILDAPLLDYDWDTTEYEDGTYTLRITAGAVAWDDPQPINRVEYTIHIDNVMETTSETTTEDTTDTTTTSTQDENGERDISGIITLGIIGVIGIAAIGVAVSKRGKKVETISKDAKVFVICPYCGAKTEQGIMKCQNCGADL